jgi:hypothetical protein
MEPHSLRKTFKLNYQALAGNACAGDDIILKGSLESAPANVRFKWVVFRIAGD